MSINWSRYKTYDTSTGFGSADEWKSAFNQRMGFEESVKVLNNRNPYQILGVSKSDSLEYIKKVFRHLALANHPDKGGNTRIMQDLNAAYSWILNSFGK